MSLISIVAIVVSYLIGAIPFGLIFARLITGKDPRLHGSGNIGATNALRTGGKKVGVLTLLADIIKGVVPVALAIYFDADETVVAMVALAAFLGHIFPVYLGFKGGKGVATMFGVVIPWMPWVAAGSFAVWLIVFKVTRYVSLASIVAGVVLPVAALAVDSGDAAVVLCSILGLIMIARHHSNIRRLMAGDEPKTGGSDQS